MLRLVSLAIAIVALSGCGTMRVVSWSRHPRGATIAYTGGWEDNANDWMRTYCGADRRPEVVGGGDVFVETGAVASTNSFGVTSARVIGRNETLLVFECKEREETTEAVRKIDRIYGHK